MDVTTEESLSGSGTELGQDFAEGDEGFPLEDYTLPEMDWASSSSTSPANASEVDTEEYTPEQARTVALDKPWNHIYRTAPQKYNDYLDNTEIFQTFHHKKSDFPKYYVRGCYTYYYHYVLWSLADVGQCVIIGSPGIGKSIFMQYFLQRYLAESKEDVTVLQTSTSDKDGTQLLSEFQARYTKVAKQRFIDEGRELPKTVSCNSVMTHLEGKTLLLFDGPATPPALGGDVQYVIFSSPNAKFLGSHSAKKSERKLFMPNWNWKELTAAWKYLCMESKITAKRLEQRYRFFGGSARYVLHLNQMEVETRQENIEKLVTRLTLPDFVNADFTLPIALGETPHSLVCIVPEYKDIPPEQNKELSGIEPPKYGLPTQYRMRVWTTAMCTSLDKQLKELEMKNEDDFFKLLLGHAQTRSLAGLQFENRACRRLAESSATFEIRYPTFSKPATIGQLPSLILSKARYDSFLVMPPHFASFDAICLIGNHLLFLQMTVAGQHTLKGQGYQVIFGDHTKPFVQSGVDGATAIINRWLSRRNRKAIHVFLTPKRTEWPMQRKRNRQAKVYFSIYHIKQGWAILDTTFGM